MIQLQMVNPVCFDWNNRKKWTILSGAKVGLTKLVS